jgi:hypothetical protein
MLEMIKGPRGAQQREPVLLYSPVFASRRREFAAKAWMVHLLRTPRLARTLLCCFAELAAEDVLLPSFDCPAKRSANEGASVNLRRVACSCKTGVRTRAALYR